MSEQSPQEVHKRGWLSHISLYGCLLTVIFTAYGGARILSSLASVAKPRVLADTTAYIRISRLPIDSIDFWAAARPPGFPLLLKIAHGDYRLTALLQLEVSSLAWGVLALMISRFFRRRGLAACSLGLILLFSLDRHISGWDTVMMSESLSLSALVFFIAAGLAALESWNALRALVFLAAASLLAMTRDTNGWMLAGLSGLIAFAVLLRWIRYPTLLLSAGLFAIFLLSNAAADLGQRWVFPLENVLGQRIVPNDDALKYFESCGMPVSPALLEFSGGRFASANDRAMIVDPELGPFREWVVVSGKSCYMKWLITHLPQSAAAVSAQLERLISFSNVDAYFSRRFDPLMPIALGRILYPEGLAFWICIYLMIAALIGIWRRSWTENRLWGAFVCLCLLVFPNLYIAWHEDAMAPERHALSVGVQLYLALWMLALLLADAILRGSVWHKPGEPDR